jgi:uncharacterized protein (UPF0332 family)
MAVMTPVILKGRELGAHKAAVSPRLDTRNVLTNSPWTFVSLWLKRGGNNKALFYWEQAHEFSRASIGLPFQSAPLLLYYSFMNAVKALLVAKGVLFDEHHGVRAHNMRKPTSKISIANEGVRIMNKGVLPALSAYYGEPEPSSMHSLQDLFFNMAFIHRTYCHTYTSQTEMFLPLTNCAYVIEKPSKNIHFRADLSKNVAAKGAMNRLPASFVAAPSLSDRTIISTNSVYWAKPSRPTEAEVGELAKLNRHLRLDLHYINGAQTLWYVKAKTSGPHRLLRQSPTIVLAAMHRLSEICRYRPLELASHLSGQKNWLLSEFIQMSPVQFIDEIASELTGHQFLMPNVRSAT